jgi:hypothetical protein
LVIVVPRKEYFASDFEMRVVRFSDARGEDFQAAVS